MAVKRFQVAISVNDSGKCDRVFKVKYVDEKEYNALLNEQKSSEQLELLKQTALEKDIESLKKQNATLKEEIKMLKGE